MKSLLTLFLFTSFAWSQDVVKITSEHLLIPSASSPVTVQMTESHEYYAFYLENATRKSPNKNSCTFDCPPGETTLRVVGLDWVDGILKPTIKAESKILITGTTTQIDEFPVAETPKKILDLKEIQSQLIEPLPKPLQGVVIEMQTNPDIPNCAPCLRWKTIEKPKYEFRGVVIREVPTRGISPPRFRIIKEGKATQWKSGFMTEAEFATLMRAFE